ncbi:AIR synthase-related protein [Geoglobus acetivorans]|uniref:Hydrogenase expression/formation protein n=1 Tax=Geoglobus acetivorans TaxID=565033 RepID=A0A0A7GGJ0_GEOAI|nr:Hydrogenase expression/formation protein [Geoglobus acetivorans]
MDIEGYARKHIDDPELERKLAERIMEFKDISEEGAVRLARAVIVEVQNAYSRTDWLLDYYRSNVSMGKFGVGSRGTGDFYVHSKIAEMCGDAVVSSKDLDDAGVVRAGDYYISVAIDGIHSRLSEFPFIAGFHVTRAAMRDVLVMGSRPVALFSDIHVADDGDVSKIFDHLAGITAVSELTDVPLVAGSTLRIGGDMVIGERMTGAVGCVGVSKHITPRRNAEAGDVIILTEGAGGGTVATAAIYYGMHEVVEETVNLDFIFAAMALIESDVVGSIHAMSDVTNGGIRGDAEEISKTSGTALYFDTEKIRGLINGRVLQMLEKLEIDFMGVSIDSLMVICPESLAEDVLGIIRKAGVNADVVGWVETGQGAFAVEDGETKPLKPRFRESAYTPIKKLVGEEYPEDFEEMKARVDLAFHKAVEKRKRVVERLRRKVPSS